jgi:hypothetical protein
MPLEPPGISAGSFSEANCLFMRIGRQALGHIETPEHEADKDTSNSTRGPY